MFIHVQGEERRRPCERVRMISRPLIDQPAETLKPGEDHPSRAASEGLCHRGKLAAPSRDAAEIPLQCPGEFAGRLGQSTWRVISVPSERFEIDLVQDDGACGSQLFT